MTRPWLLIIAMFAIVPGAYASRVSLKVDAGDVKVWSAKTSVWTPVIDTADIESGDSIATGETGLAMVQLSSDAVVKLKGSTAINLTLYDNGITIAVNRGQLFLSRVDAQTFSTIVLFARDCRFIPTGTAFALRLGKSGEPSVAVLAGKVKAELPSGEGVDILPGMVGTLDLASSSFKLNELPPSAIAGLEEWSGVKLAKLPPPVVAAKADSKAGSTSSSSVAPAISGSTEHPVAAVEQSAAKSAVPEPEVSSVGSVAPPAEALAPAKAAPAGAEKPSYELSAGSVTVGDQQWTRMAFGIDIPMWKFGVFLDIELFVNSQGQFSDRGWNFDKSNWGESVLRKIRYVRFGHENEPLFVKFGGLENVTFGYGFVVDRFTNTLHYPDERNLGLQFYLNDVSPLGVTIQSFTADTREFNIDGGIWGARLGVKPLKPSAIPIIGNLLVAGTYVTDRNQFAPTRSWHLTPLGSLGAYNYLRSKGVDSLEALDSAARWTGGDAIKDSILYAAKKAAIDKSLPFGIAGGDVSVPIVTTSLVNLDIYGQAASRVDDVRGWGFGAPGAKLTVGPAWAQAEYRHVSGRFEPGYFGTSYMTERCTDDTVPTVKSESLEDIDLTGVFGSLGCNVANAIIIGGSYQYMLGKNDASDQRFEAHAGLGDIIVKKIPKLSKMEGYYSKTNIGSSPVYTPAGRYVRARDNFFDQTPGMNYGYRLGIAITPGANLIWDARYGYEYKGKRRVPNNNVSIQTAVTF